MKNKSGGIFGFFKRTTFNKPRRALKDSHKGFTRAIYFTAVVLGVGALVYQCCEIVLKVNARSASTATDWGVSFQTEGQTPVGNKDDGYLLPYNACFHGDESKKCLYLTFDAGYENGFTEKILDTLKANDVNAAFFLTGNYVRDQADLIKRMNAEGHTVCNHTMSHPDVTRLSAEEFAAQLEGVSRLYSEHTGKQMPLYFRPPAGKFDETVLSRAKELGYKTILWSLAYNDWDNNAQPSKQEALNTLYSRTHNGAIILLHSTGETNSLILDEYLKAMKSQGYEFLPLSALVWE